MQSKSVIQAQSKSLRLDFFPRCVEAMLTKVSDTKLVASKAKAARFTSPHDIRFCQCDCACK